MIWLGRLLVGIIADKLMSSLFSNENPSKEGWICPKCKSVWSPDVKKCQTTICKPVEEDKDTAKDTRTFLTE